MPLRIRAIEFAGDLSDFRHEYKYQPKLTKKLDNLEDLNLTLDLLNEIVLWKAGANGTTGLTCQINSQYGLGIWES